MPNTNSTIVSNLPILTSTKTANSLDDAISAADTIQDLVRITPKSFQTPFAVLLKSVYELAVKQSNTQKAVMNLEQHLARGTFPAHVFGSLKIPAMQVSKEFSSTGQHASFLQRAQTVLKDVQTEFLTLNIGLKKAESQHLQSRLSDEKLSVEATATIDRVFDQLRFAYESVDSEGKTVLSPVFDHELKKIRTHGQDLCRKAMALGFIKHQRDLCNHTNIPPRSR